MKNIEFPMSNIQFIKSIFNILQLQILVTTLAVYFSNNIFVVINFQVWTLETDAGNGCLQ